MYIDVDFKERVEYWLEKKHMTVYDVAKRVGKPASTLYNAMEPGKDVRTTTVKTFCQGLDISLSDFWVMDSNRIDISANIYEREYDIIRMDRCLDDIQHQRIIAYMEGMISENK